MTAKIITSCNQKGGCGKTCVAMTTAGAIAARGYRVLVVDGDPQGTATRWYASASPERPFPAVVINLAEARANIARAVKDHLENYDVIVIDCPPATESPITLAALAISDLALVPLIPAPGDVWAVVKLCDALEQARALNPDLQARIVINMMQPTTLATEALDVLKEIPIETAESSFSLRTAYRQALAEATTVLQLKDPKAVGEAEALAAEVLQIVGLARKRVPRTALAATA